MAAVAVLSLRSLSTLCGLPPFGSLGLELNALAPFEDRPPPLKNPYTENPDTENPYTENPYTENPDTENPYTDKGNRVYIWQIGNFTSETCYAVFLDNLVCFAAFRGLV